MYLHGEKEVSFAIFFELFLKDFQVKIHITF